MLGYSLCHDVPLALSLCYVRDIMAKHRHVRTVHVTCPSSPYYINLPATFELFSMIALINQHLSGYLNRKKQETVK